MKALPFAFALAAVVTTPAFAQDVSLAYRGSGQHAGGPAYLFYPREASSGGPVALGPVTRSGQMSGGPAREFIAWERAPVSLEGTVNDPARSLPFGYDRSGTRAGGPHRF